MGRMPRQGRVRHRRPAARRPDRDDGVRSARRDRAARPTPCTDEGERAGVRHPVRSPRDAQRIAGRDLPAARGAAYPPVARPERRLSRSTEAVETIATAIFGSCVLKEQSYRKALVLSYRGRISASKGETLAGDFVDRRGTR